MKRQLGVVIIGAGDMGARHAHHWVIAGAKLIAVCDPNCARAEAVAAPFGAEAYDSPDEPLKRDDVDVVSVCTPTFLHDEYSIQALEAGKDVLCEKPVALTLADAERMKAAALKSRRKLRIGFMRRFDPAYHQLMAYRQHIGNPVLAQATIAAGIRPKLLMHDAMANGGPIIDMCCHIFDQWVGLFDSQPESVTAYGYTFSQNKPELESIKQKALDSAHITLNYPDGSVGQIQVSWGLPAGIAPIEHHTYMGPDGLITLDWPQQLTLRNSAGTTRWDNNGVDPWKTEIMLFYRELVDGERRHLATVGDGIEVLKTSLAVLESVARQRAVNPAEIVLKPELKETA